MSTTTRNMPTLSIRAQVLATLTAIVGAVVLPQLFHQMGHVLGLGTQLGEIFLPMHLPILLVGLLAGPYAGAIAGALGPVTSFLLSGMPSAAMLPFMVLELGTYGLCAGLLRNVKMQTGWKVLLTQILGRAIRALGILVSVFVFSNTTVGVASIGQSILTGTFGIVLQLVLLPWICSRVEQASHHED